MHNIYDKWEHVNILLQTFENETPMYYKNKFF